MFMYTFPLRPQQPPLPPSKTPLTSLFLSIVLSIFLSTFLSIFLSTFLSPLSLPATRDIAPGEELLVPLHTDPATGRRHARSGDGELGRYCLPAH